MKIHRFITNTNIDGDSISLSGDVAHQIAHVLKLAIDEMIELSDGRGTSRRGKITFISKSSVEVQLEETLEATERTRPVVLYCAILKKENFELVVQKATEVGVTEIVPVITERTVKLGLKLDRLQKIATEAAEQSGRSVVPTIHEPKKFTDALADAKRNEMNMIFDMSGGAISLKNKKSIGLFIGPEGGWTKAEIDAATNAGIKTASLGATTLRAETAAIIATYLCVNS